MNVSHVMESYFREQKQLKKVDPIRRAGILKENLNQTELHMML